MLFNNNVSSGSGVGVYDEHVQWESREGGDASSAEPGCWCCSCRMGRSNTGRVRAKKQRKAPLTEGLLSSRTQGKGSERIKARRLERMTLRAVSEATGGEREEMLWCAAHSLREREGGERRLLRQLKMLALWPEMCSVRIKPGISAQTL